MAKRRPSAIGAAIADCQLAIADLNTLLSRPDASDKAKVFKSSIGNWQLEMAASIAESM